MKNNLKNIVTVAITGLTVLGFALGCWLFPEEEFSESERRYLAAFPDISAKSILSAKFMTDFDTYTTDRFPMRDGMRGIKAAFSELLMLRDNGGIYRHGGHIGKLEYPLNDAMLSHAAEVFSRVYRDMIEGRDCRVFLSVVPDKNLYLAPEAGALSLDYDALQDTMAEKLPFAEPIDLCDTLDLSCYYTTDTHWRQEKLLPAAERLLSAMGTGYGAEFSEELVSDEFYGVLRGQSALPHDPDSIVLLTNKALSRAEVFDYKGDPLPLYDMDKLQGLDPYEVYLSGTQPIVVLEDPAAETGRELIVFRDSFGSSIAPLLLQGYSRVTLVDLRYMQADLLPEYLEFRDQDVLILMSSLILNSSGALK